MKILLILILLAIMTALVNPACSESAGPGRGNDIPGNITIFDQFAVWSETHNSIAYVQLRSPDTSATDTLGIYTVMPDGTEKRMRYRYGDVFVGGLDWSQDGDWLITNAGQRLVKISFHTGDADTLTQQGEYWYPAFSPDGNSITYAVHVGDSRGVYIMSIEGTNSRLVIPYAHSPSWPYPDSLLYLNFDQELPIGAICMADTGGNFKRVVYQTGSNFNYATPAAKMHAASERIIFHAREIGDFESIWTLESHFEQPVQLKRFAMYPYFSPDGDRVVFTNIQHGDGKLWLINWDGTGLVQLTH